MRVYTTQTMMPGRKIYLCQPCYEKDCKQDSGTFLPTEKVDWKNHTELKCVLCERTFTAKETT